MKKTTRSILQELNNLSLHRDKKNIIETSGTNLIESCINLLSQINDAYTPEEAMELERRFLNSIRTGDARKFKRGLIKVTEAKKWY